MRLKPLSVWITRDDGKFLKRIWNTRSPYLPPEKPAYRSKAVVRTGHGTMNWFKAVYCHLAYSIYMQSTSYYMLSWMKHKLESSLPGGYEDATTLMAEIE